MNFPYNGALWSLPFELFANAVHMFIDRFSAPKILPILIVSSGAGLALSVYYFGSADIGMTGRTVLGGVPRVLFSYFMGVAIFKFGSRIPFREGSALLIFVATAFLFTMEAEGHRRIFLDLLAIFVLLPLLVHSFASLRVHRSLEVVFSFLGTASYALYVIHLPSLKLAFGAWDVVFKFEPTPYIVTLVFVPILILGAFALTKIYDDPVAKAIKRLKMRRATASA